jgi:hypothetical protein
MNGFCPHKRAIPGLDAYWCPDCKQTFTRGTPIYEALAKGNESGSNAEIQRLREENAALREELRAAQNTIRRAKDINPVQRPSLKRVMRLVADACMSLQKLASGWLLKLGHQGRRFKSLSQIWELLSGDDWSLGDIFPEESGGETPRVLERFIPRLPQRHGSLAPARSYGPLHLTDKLLEAT